MDYYSNNDVSTNNYADVSDEKPFNIALFKVYLWLGLGLLITGVISLGLPYLFAGLVAAGVSSNTMATVYLVCIIVSAIVLLPCCLMMQFTPIFANSKSALTTTIYIVFTVAMGVFLSSIMMPFLAQSDGMKTICIAFLVTAGSFLIMGFIGAITKKDLNILWPLLASLVFGCLIISIVNIFTRSAAVYWIVDFVIFGIMLLVIAIDVHNVNRLAKNHAFDNNTSFAIYCAFSLYVDFIWIFIRILSYIAILRNK